ncbi:MAG: hypothetical protein WCX90_06805 [Thiohalomonadaceae bacterium]
MKHLQQLLAMVVLVLTLSAPTLAGQGGRTPQPSIPVAKGEQCVEDKSDMRRNHMDYLKHHRDETMHRGIRTEKYSLKACLECHVPVEDSMATSAGNDEGHFCINCHVYAGVTLDCFECHATKPESTAQFHPLVTPGSGIMQDVGRANTAELLNNLVKNSEDNAGVAHE